MKLQYAFNLTGIMDVNNYFNKLMVVLPSVLLMTMFWVFFLNVFNLMFFSLLCKVFTF